MKKKSPCTITAREFSSPLGTISVASSERGLCALELPTENGKSRLTWLENKLTKRFKDFKLVDEISDSLEEVLIFLDNFFIDPMTVAPFPGEIDTGGTSFQQSVWNLLRQIPPGKVLSYGEVAQRIGKPKATRAVGTACGANPLPIIIPCHRVVGSDRSLGGFGAGTAIKKKLLLAEGWGFNPRNKLSKLNL